VQDPGALAAALPPGDPGLFKMTVGFADRLGPLTGAELTQLKDAAADTQPLFTAPNA